MYPLEGLEASYEEHVPRDVESALRAAGKTSPDNPTAALEVLYTALILVILLSPPGQSLLGQDFFTKAR